MPLNGAPTLVSLNPPSLRSAVASNVPARSKNPGPMGVIAKLFNGTPSLFNPNRLSIYPPTAFSVGTASSAMSTNSGSAENSLISLPVARPKLLIPVSPILALMLTLPVP